VQGEQQRPGKGRLVATGGTVQEAEDEQYVQAVDCQVEQMEWAGREGRTDLRHARKGQPQGARYGDVEAEVGP